MERAQLLSQNSYSDTRPFLFSCLGLDLYIKKIRLFECSPSPFLYPHPSLSAQEVSPQELKLLLNLHLGLRCCILCLLEL